MQCNGTCLYILARCLLFTFVYITVIVRILYNFSAHVSIHVDFWQICIDSVIMSLIQNIYMFVVTFVIMLYVLALMPSYMKLNNSWRKHRIMLIYINFKFNFLTKYRSFILNCWRIRMFSRSSRLIYYWYTTFASVLY